MILHGRKSLETRNGASRLQGTNYMSKGEFESLGASEAGLNHCIWRA